MEEHNRWAYSTDLISAQQKLDNLRDQLKRDRRWPVAGAVRPDPQEWAGLSVAEQDSAEKAPSVQTVKIYPDVALGMLRQRRVAAGRIWLLLHHLDKNGQGWVSISQARNQLTGKESTLKVCGRRQFRKLLVRGEGLFWQRANDRLWLRSTAKVAHKLGLSCLRGRPIALPIAILLEGMGTVRAHFYASFHSGRRDGSRARNACRPRKTGPGNPISRRTLQQLSHRSRRTLQNYDRRAGVRRKFNYAIGLPDTKQEIQSQAWKHGQAFFRFKDYQGSIGPKERTYTAWQLPNSYDGPHQLHNRGRMKSINREVADLFMKGITGNDNFSRTDAGSSPGSLNYERWYCSNSSSAARTFNRKPERDVFWHSRLDKRADYGLWHVLPAQEK